LIGLGLTLIPLLTGWKFAVGFSGFLAVGVLLGIAGASFAVALPLASAWYPPEYQGLAMGIAGAGNTGTLLATLFAPRLANAFGWHSVFGIATIPVAVVWVAFFLMAKDAPAPKRVKRWREYAELFHESDTAWFCFLYSLTFGGFVGLASYLPVFFHDQYGLSKVQAGDSTTIVVLFGSFLRPAGGVLADKIGGYRMLVGLLGGIAVLLGAVTSLPPFPAALFALVLAMAMLGMGNGSVFQLVPQRFPTRVGIITGIVGAAGGFGGFLLPALLGTVKDRTGSFALGFAILSVAAFGGMAALVLLGRVWRRTWTPESASRAGLRKLVRTAAR